MLSYSYQPHSMILSSPESRKPQQSQQQPGHESGTRISATIPEDLVTFDYLIGVASIDREYSFVQYKPTEKHKQRAGLKVDPLQQINMFIQMLQDNSVPIETSLYTLMPSGKKSLWTRVLLTDLTELSLEPLWMIKGRAQLYSKQQRVGITIEDNSIESCSLDPRSQLLFSQPHRNWIEEFLSLSKEGISDSDRKDSNNDDDDSDCHSNIEAHAQPRGEDRDKDRVEGSQKRKMYTKDDVSDTVTKCTNCEPAERVELGQRQQRHTPNVVNRNFNRGMQTRMKNRHYQHKRGSKTFYRRTPQCYTINASLCEEPKLPMSPSPVLQQVYPQQLSAAQDITSYIYPVSVTSPQVIRQSLEQSQISLLSATEQTLQGNSANSTTVHHVELCVDDPVSTVEILPIVHPRSSLQSQPSQPHTPVAEMRTEGPLNRNCSIM